MSRPRRVAQPVTIPGDLERLRAQIDDVDTRLAALIEERAQLAVAVQHTRTSTDHGHDVSRERALLEKAAAGEGGVLTPEEREQVFAAVLRVSRAAQRREAATAAAREAEAPKAAAGTAA